jgi:type I restriction enzyme S subunit
MKLYTSNKGVFPDDWKIVKLGSLCDLQNGYAFKSTDYVDSSNTLSCRMSNIRPDGEFDLDYHPKFLPDPYADKYQQFLLKDNDVIIAMTDMATEPKILGVPTVVSTKGRNVLLNQRVGKLVIKDKDSIFFPYLKRVLGTNRAKQHYLRFAGGGVQINLSKEDLLSLEIPLPPLEEQRRIAAILDKADGVRRKRKEAIRLTEELLKSTFLEMFGDPVTNPKGWGVVSLGSLLKFLTSGSRGWARYYADNGSLFLRIQNVKAGRLLLDDIAYVDAPDSTEARRTSVQEGDVLVSMTADLGRTAVIPKGLGKAHINQHLALLRLDREYILPTYAAAFLASVGGQIQFDRLNREAVKAGLNFDDLRGIKILLPPLEKQIMYSDFLESQTNSLNRQKAASSQSENLFNSLLQRAFRGEL